MELILLSDQRNLGRRGEVVKVKPGYARNFLLPQGLALEATPANMKYFAEQRKKIDARHTKERDAAAEVAARIAEIKLVIAKKVGETQTLYGSVTTTDIAEALAAKGVEIDRRKIEVHGGIKALGDHKVAIDLHPEVVAELVVSVVPEE